MRLPLLAAALWALVATGPAIAQAPAQLEEAVFASGCFWCTEADFDKVEGVVETTSGYIAGRTENPTYEQVSAGGTGHVEAVRVRFDPAKVSYAELLRTYWPNVDPLDGGGQFCDRGDQYRPALFPRTEEQERLAHASLKAAGNALGKPIAVSIEPEAGQFWPAEDYHQNYAHKNPVRYGFYRYSCGRDARLAKVWKGVPALDF